MPLATFPDSDEAAEALFNQYASKDPFPSIPCGLLNSADIQAYLSTVGIMYPVDGNGLKSASCTVSVGTRAIYWDNRKRLNDLSLRPGEALEVPPNSIVYIWTKEKFRLPPYIAIRFNLKIRNVHQGLLLGTGPLVDPGFEGHLLIPVHNLTTNIYHFREGETFVWVEFTKVTPNKHWTGEKQQPDFDYVTFPAAKKNMKAWDYLDQAGGGPFLSSISDAIQDAQRSAEVAKHEAKRLSSFGWVGLLAVAATMATLVYQGFSLLQDNKGQLQGQIEELKSQMSELRELVTEMQGPAEPDGN